MKIEIENVLPADIEKKSFEIIEKELPHPIDEKLAPIIKRVVHTTADFEYVDSLYFSDNILEIALEALRKGATIVTDTNMGKSGINKKALEQLGCKVECFMADSDVAAIAKENGTTRATASVDKASKIEGPVIFACGNAPTALVRMCELMEEGKLSPAFIVGVPVGFVNVVPAKEMIIESGVSCIVARGRKGGSNVAAAIINALMYMITDRDK